MELTLSLFALSISLNSGYLSDVAKLLLLYCTWEATLLIGGTRLIDLYVLGHLESFKRNSETKKIEDMKQTYKNNRSLTMCVGLMSMPIGLHHLGHITKQYNVQQSIAITT